MTELDLGIIEKVKNILNVTEDNSPLELLQILRRHRTNFHPDKYSDPIAKAEAEAKFVEMSTLINELDSHIQRERLQKSPMELALYEPLYDNSTLQAKLDAAENEISELQKRIQAYESQISELKENLKDKQEDVITQKQDELIAIYKTSNKRAFSLSALFVLSGLIPILTKIETVSLLITKYAPFTASQMNLVMFFIFILVLVISIKKFFEYRIVKNRIFECKSPNTIKCFLDSIPDKKEFSENQVYDFIYGKKTKIKKILNILGFRNYKSETVSHLKDVFIHNLIYKQFVDIGFAENLDRTFRIKTKPKYYHEIYG